LRKHGCVKKIGRSGVERYYFSLSGLPKKMKEIRKRDKAGKDEWATKDP